MGEEEADFPLPAETARIRVGDVEAKADVPPGATSVTLTLDLPAGPARFQSFLTAADGTERDAFYVEIERLK